MGLEYKIETYDQARVELPAFLRRLPEFLYEEGGELHLGLPPATLLFTVKIESDYVYICQHVAARESDALLGLVIRHILGPNDHVVISEL